MERFADAPYELGRVTDTLYQPSPCGVIVETELLTFSVPTTPVETLNHTYDVPASFNSRITQLKVPAFTETEYVIDPVVVMSDTV